MFPDETDELSCLNVTVLRRWLGEREQEAVEMFIRLNWLTAGQSLEELGDEKTCRCLSEFDKIIGALDREVERKRQVERDQQAAKVRAEFNLRKIIEARRHRVIVEIPVSYSEITAEKSPRPAQFKFVRDYWETEDAKPGLFLTGKPRIGKTAAAWELWKQFTLNGDDTFFLKTVHLAGLAKTRTQSKECNSEFRTCLDHALEADLLILDDLVTERLSPSVEVALYEIIDHRTENDELTVITSNFTIDQLAGKFSPDNTGKIIGRLKQFFLEVNFDHL